MTVDDCVRIAVSDNAEVEEAQAKVDEWAARLAEVRSVYYPKLTALSYVAPMFTVRGSPLEPDVDRDYSPDACEVKSRVAVAALSRLASTGIPLQAKKAFQDAKERRTVAELSEEVVTKQVEQFGRRCIPDGGPPRRLTGGESPPARRAEPPSWRIDALGCVNLLWATS